MLYCCAKKALSWYYIYTITTVNYLLYKTKSVLKKIFRWIINNDTVIFNFRYGDDILFCVL